MAGDWIKMRVNLVAHPKVLRMADYLLNDPKYLEWSALSYSHRTYPPLAEHELRDERNDALRITRYVCVTSLLRFWGYANEHAKGEYIESLTPHHLDEIAGVPGFGEALESVGWAEFEEDGGVTLHGFSEHNTSAEVRKSGAAERQKAYRDRQKLKIENGDVTRDVTSHAREEKRREEKKEKETTRETRFGEFWNHWPKSNRKGGKSECAKVWTAKGFDCQTDLILAHVDAMSKTQDWTKESGQYIPAPVAYLRAQKWDGADVSEPQTTYAGAV